MPSPRRDVVHASSAGDGDGSAYTRVPSSDCGLPMGLRPIDAAPVAEILGEMAEAHLRQEAASERDKWKDFARTALHCVFWSLAGLACIGMAFHTTDITYGKMMFFSGVGIGNLGVLYSLGAAYRRGEKRGDW